MRGTIFAAFCAALLSACPNSFAQLPYKGELLERIEKAKKRSFGIVTCCSGFKLNNEKNSLSAERPFFKRHCITNQLHHESSLAQVFFDLADEKEHFGSDFVTTLIVRGGFCGSSV